MNLKFALVFALAVVLTFSSAVPISFASNPEGIVQYCSATGTVYPSGAITCTLNGVTAGDGLIVAFSYNYVESNTLTGITVTSNTLTTIWTESACQDPPNCSSQPESYNVAGMVYVPSATTGGNLQVSLSASGGSGGIGTNGAYVTFIETIGPLSFSNYYTDQVSGGGNTLMSSGAISDFPVACFAVVDYSMATAVSTEPSGWNIINNGQTVTYVGQGVYEQYPWVQGGTTYAADTSLSSASKWAGGVTVFSGSGQPIYVTAWNLPDSTALGSAVIFLLFLLIPTYLISSIAIIERKSKNIGTKFYIFFQMLGLLFASFLGGLTGNLPIALTAVFGGILGVYLWRGRRHDTQ